MLMSDKLLTTMDTQFSYLVPHSTAVPFERMASSRSQYHVWRAFIIAELGSEFHQLQSCCFTER
jgi:hypothetical protein